MPQPDLTQWEDNKELLEVRECLFPQDGTQLPHRRRAASDKILAWVSRGGVPHAIDSTALIVNATLHDIPTSSPEDVQSVRCMYSVAISRLVTGFTDVEQNKKRKRSMYDVGKGIGLPSALIELRHQIIHEDLPTLVVLRQNALRALKWLYEYYWRRLELEFPVPVVGENFTTPDVQEECRKVLSAALQEHRKKCLRACNSKEGKDLEATIVRSAGEASRIITRSCQNNRSLLHLLINILLMRGCLIPMVKPLSRDIERMFLVWDDLLRLICNHQSIFPGYLVDSMFRRLYKEHFVSHDESETYVQWLTHIHTDQRWVNIRNRHALRVERILKNCLKKNWYPWTLRLGLAIVKLDETAALEFRESLEESMAKFKSINDATFGLADFTIGTGPAGTDDNLFATLPLVAVPEYESEVMEEGAKGKRIKMTEEVTSTGWKFEVTDRTAYASMEMGDPPP